MTEKEIIEFHRSLNVYELLIYGILLRQKKENIKSTLNEIQFEVVEYILKNRIDIDEGNSITKTLPKLATFDETTQEWNLKSKEQILQELKSKRKTKIKKECNNA